KAGSEENASASDIIRGEVARLSDNDPRKEIMQKLEMDAFVQEERAKKALDERRISKNHHMKQVEKLQTSTEKPISMIPFKSSHISRQKSSFSF
ncbi:hypothetical protein, partial [Klebsiella pneumoniae]|uniref:hypothetical protein n=1 Tax=Klebsiella pneumoniae TaxID=573 RepID=UPI0020109F96